MFIVKDKNGTVLFNAQNISESYNAFTHIAEFMKTQLFITVESDRANGVTLASIVNKLTTADLSELTIVNEEGDVVDVYTEYDHVLTVTKTLQNGGMTIDITLITSEAAE